MKLAMKQFAVGTATTLMALLFSSVSLADDTELFIGNSADQDAAYPNLLFILDNSGSMADTVNTSDAYNPATIYAGDCDPDKVFYQSGGINNQGDAPEPPTCDRDTYITQAALKCGAAASSLADAGFFSDRLTQYGPVEVCRGGGNNQTCTTTDQWHNLDINEHEQSVECRADAGVHGETAGSSAVYATDNSGPWTSNSNGAIRWNGRRTYTLFSANYINYYWSTGGGPRPKIDIVKEAAVDLINSMNNVNIGLMNFDNESGGDVIVEMGNISTKRADFVTQVRGMNANGWTPLSETLYEAGQYYMGRQVDWGNQNRRSIDASRSVLGDTYKSPVAFECQKNFVVLLTDGYPNRDGGSNAQIQSLPDYNSLVGVNCSAETVNGTGVDGSGACLDDMAQYMYEADIAPNLAGKQNVVTYTIGFDINFPLIADTARKGGGSTYPANDAKSLATVLTTIVRDILDTQTTFVAPTVSVNAFNRTQTRDDLYVALFSPSNTEAWPGNIKKYRLVDGQIVGTDMATSVVDPNTGFIKDNVRSFWSATTDGDEVRLGGAASKLPTPANRTLLTSLGGTTLSNVIGSNDALVTHLQTLPGVTTAAIAQTIIQHARGVDVKDENQNGDRTDPRYWMGDPLHAKPEMVTYGGTTANPDPEDNVLYTASNDGYLHAIDPVSGVERWAFIPYEMLEMLPFVYRNNAVSDQTYGIDGNIRTVVVDINNDGVVDSSAGDKVYLYFGLRRGGDSYYGLDVTDKDAPTLMWTQNPGGLPGQGESWSTPTPIRVNISGAGQNARKLALVFGAGYDTRQDNGGYAADSFGKGIFIIDALSGDLLWQAADTGANFNSARMTNSFVADIRALDITNDGYTDRLYASDLGGQVWRFDLTNGQSANSFATGGVIATLGGAADSVTATENRRFYYAPDAALVTTRYGRFMHVGIGSGYRAHPLDTVTEDRFYALRDFYPFSKMTQAQYDSFTPLTDADIQDVTDNVAPNLAPNAAGWRLELRLDGWIGEKVLSESRTFADTVYFTTFTPGANTNPCQPGAGLNKLYAVNVVDGSPVNNMDGVGQDTDLTVDDRVRSLAQGGIAPEIVFLFPDPKSCTSGDCDAVYGFVGLEGIGDLSLPPYVRTYWEQAGSE